MNTQNGTHHFLKCTDFSAAEAARVIAMAAQLKAGRGAQRADTLEGQTWALIFQKASTRTRVSFEVGIHELGGHPMVLDQGKTQMGRGETIEDTAKVLSRYIHGLVVRCYEQSLLEELAAHGSIPVVNALTDAYHPCQIYADILTLTEQWGGRAGDVAPLAGRKLVFYGDCSSNMAHSWILGGTLFGMEIVLSGPERYQPEAFVDTDLQRAQLPKTYRYEADPHKAAAGADVIYTDVWVSMGDEAEREARLQAMTPYQVNAAIMAAAKPEAVFMHCLPAHEGEEVGADVYRSAQSIVYDQAENRLHCQKAILTALTRGL